MPDIIPHGFRKEQLALVRGRLQRLLKDAPYVVDFSFVGVTGGDIVSSNLMTGLDDQPFLLVRGPAKWMTAHKDDMLRRLSPHYSIEIELIEWYPETL